MIDKNPNDRNRLINVVLFAVACILLAASIFSVYSAWRTGLDQSRAETASRLMAIRTSPRSTETPGINAWVSWSLLNNSGTSFDNEGLRRLVSPRSGDQLPVEFQGVLDVLKTQVPEAADTVNFSSSQDSGPAEEPSDLEFRRVGFVDINQQLLVYTARQDKFYQERLVDHAALAGNHLIAIRDAWQNKSGLPELDQLPQVKSVRVARFYILNQDESLLSLPLDTENDDVTPEQLFHSEADEFRKNPLSPSFVSNSFFFNFQYSQPLENQVMFSGMYLDLGGLGLIASVTRPVIYNGNRCVLGADVAFEFDWEKFAQSLSPNLSSHIASVSNTESAYWSPWTEFYKGIPGSQMEMKSAMRELAERESLTAGETPRKSVYVATTPNGNDAMAIQVDRSTWLLLLVTANEIRLPWATMLLTSLVFSYLFWRVESSRRKAVQARRAARGELQEKQNLLDTMQVPLMVVDPNTDEVVYCNRAAEAIGMMPGHYFGKDIVAQDADSQEQYRRTQTPGGEHRRAYGVPIRVQPQSDDAPVSGTEKRHAIVRSVAVTAPIETLRADERHRLGILFLVDERVDLAMLLEQRLDEAKQDEKRRLSGLMNHGIDSLARVLRNRLVSSTAFVAGDGQGSCTASEMEFTNWLGAYLAERIQLLSWTLENWGREPNTAEQRVIQRDTVEQTLQHYNQVFSIAANDRKLREEMHWNNGTLATMDSSPLQAAIETSIDWDRDCYFVVPRDGVFGFMMGEALVNAVRHGQAGSVVRVTIVQDRVRNELQFRVANATITSSSHSEKPFGGMNIVRELARLSGWTEPANRIENGQFVMEWTAPAILKKRSGLGD